MSVDTSPTVGPNRQGSTNITEWNLANTTVSGNLRIHLNFYDVAKAVPTSISGFTITYQAGSQITQANHTASTAFDSFSLIFTSGNTTGSYSVFGYNK